MMKYHVIENRNISILCSPEFKETILFTGSKEECIAYEAKMNQEHKDDIDVEYFIQSEEERNNLRFK